MEGKRGTLVLEDHMARVNRPPPPAKYLGRSVLSLQWEKARPYPEPEACNLIPESEIKHPTDPALLCTEVGTCR